MAKSKREVGVLQAPHTVLAHLAESGVSPALAGLCGLTWEEGRLGFPHYEPDGSPMVWHDAPFVRHRLFARDAESGAWVPVRGEGAPRYLQPAGSRVRVYWPPACRNWPAVLADPTRDLGITEGEKKAITACASDIPTLSLAGVDGWRARGYDHPDLEKISWAGRRVYLFFDADIVDKPSVQRALEELGEWLYLRGALPLYVDLSTLGGKLDDAIVGFGIDALREAMRAAVPPVHPEVWKLNDRLAYVAETHSVYDTQRRREMSLDQARAYFATLPKVTRLGDRRKIPALKAWEEWAGRREVDRLEMRCDERTIIEEPGAGGGPPVRIGNTWRGWAVVPKPSAVHEAAWLALLSNVCGGDAALVAWLERWVAWRIRTGKRVHTGVLLIGPQGSGKSWFCRIVAAIHGEHARLLTPTSLSGGAARMEWAMNTSFAYLDDSEGPSRRVNIGALLKSLLTEERLRIDPKYVASREIRNEIQFAACSNHFDELQLMRNDRRWCAIESTQPLPNDVINALAQDSEALHSAVLHRLMTIKLGKFSPNAAPATDLRAIVEDATSYPEEQWLHAIRERTLDPRALPPFRIIRASELWSAWSSYVDQHRVTRGPINSMQGLFALARSAFGPRAFRRIRSRKLRWAAQHPAVVLVLDQDKETWDMERLVDVRVEEEERLSHVTP